MNRFLVSSSALLLLATCSSGGADPCTARRIVCKMPEICDPDDGVCKCGGRGGVVCPMNFACDSATNTCLSNRCAGVDCGLKPGTSCDRFDGVCKCGGTGGMECKNTESCEPQSKKCVPTINCNDRACSRNQTCDVQSGVCRCGTATCADDQFCAVNMDMSKACTMNICNGVHCAGANECDKNDGYCKCNGAICQSGEACACPAGSDGGECPSAQRACRTGSACATVACDGGTTCDPVDGQCKCGGPGGPACASNQICALARNGGQCQGGAQCVNPDGGPKVCSGGTSCDPEDGKCKCGGRGGTVCGAADAGTPGEVCVSTALQQTCRRPCSPIAPDCTAPQVCFFDSSAATPVAYCAVPTGTQQEDQACQQATACFSGMPARPMHCNGLALGTTGICKPYCDTTAGMSGCLQVPFAQICSAIVAAPAMSNYGFCQRQ